MKVKLYSLLAASLLAVSTLQGPALHAGPITTSALGQGGGTEQRASYTGNKVIETYDRARAWQAPIAYTALSGTCIVISITQTTGTLAGYNRSWEIRILNAGPSTCSYVNATYTAANSGTSALVTASPALAATTGARDEPVDVSSTVQLRGLTATATGFYQIGTFGN